MSATQKAAVHLGPNFEQHLCITKNTDFEQLRTLFDISQKLIKSHGGEICGVSTFAWHLAPWRGSCCQM